MNAPSAPWARAVIAWTAVALLILTGCGAGTGRSGGSAGAADCANPPAPDVATSEGWVGYIAAHRDDVAFVVDDGRGTRLEHRADVVQPLASAGKALNMVAYARAAALGTVRPDEPVRIADWERWSVTGTESSHAQALDYLGIPRNGERAADPGRTVTLDQLANVMIIFSDNAAPDYLRHRLGDRALVDAARDVGWRAPELPSTAGFTLSLYYPERVDPESPPAARRAAEWDLALRYAFDPAFRREADQRPGVPPAEEYRRAAGAPGGTARELEGLWSAVARGTFPGADRARTIGEQKPNPFPGVLARGTKGGSLPGIVTSGYELRRDDGTVATLSLLVQGMSQEDGKKVNDANGGVNDFIVDALQDPDTTAALRCLT